MFMFRFASGGAVLALFIVRGSAAQSVDPGSMLTRVGDYVERYYARAQSLVATETVVIQPLTRDMGVDGFARHVVNEMRIEWDPLNVDEPATVIRQQISARGPTLGPPNQPDCLDPKAASPEPLTFLLSTRRPKFRFSVGRSDTIDGVRAQRIDYRPLAPEAPKVEWKNDCGSIDLPGRTGGRVWVDPASGEVLRFDEHLIGLVDVPGPRSRRPNAPLFFTIERADTAISYRRVAFADPEEVVLLPWRVESLSVIRNSGVPRLRVTQTFTNYRRFITASRIVP
jgi:hypothetical protein